jgi:hypothetical protein
MSIFDFIKKKKPKEVEKTPEQAINIEQVKIRHQNRIDNLNNEARDLSHKLTSIEEDEEMIKTKKAKASDIIIQRLTFIKYEIGIRESLISWL